MTHIPKIEDHLPEFMAFVREMGAAYKNGDLTDWANIVSRVEAFFTPAASAKMEKLVPGWAKMASYQDGRTQTHTVCVLIAMYNLPEFEAASPEEKNLYEWIGLLHDIAKKPPPRGIREHFHAFTSAAQAAPILAELGFSTQLVYTEIISNWQAYTRSANVFQDDMQFPDNSKLPQIIEGIDQMFDAESPAALILKAILFHISFSWISDWPSAAPLSEDEVRAYIDEPLLDALIIMALMDTDAWQLFDDSPRDEYRREIEAFKTEMLEIIDELRNL